MSTATQSTKSNELETVDFRQTGDKVERIGDKFKSRLSRRFVAGFGDRQLCCQCVPGLYSTPSDPLNGFGRGDEGKEKIGRGRDGEKGRVGDGKSKEGMRPGEE